MSSGPSLGPLTLWRRIRDARRGNVRALEDLYHLRGVVTFVVVFAATVGVPGVLLAYYGIAGVRAEQRAADGEMSRDGNFAVTTFEARLKLFFRTFEDATLNRLKAGQSVHTALPELSEALRVVFRFDAEAKLVAPFRREDAAPWADLDRFTLLPWRQARAAEQSGAHGKAAGLYGALARTELIESARGEAAFSRARALAAAGDARAAEAAFAQVAAEFAGARGSRGFRIGDIAGLKRAELLHGRDPDAGEAAIRELVESLLLEDWTVGRGGEAAVCRRAIDLAGAEASRDWVARTRARIDERDAQLYWAGRLLAEMDSLGAKGRYLMVNPGSFSYHLRQQALWAMTWTESDLYVFALDLDVLRARLGALADQVVPVGRPVAARLASESPPRRERVLAEGNLVPWFPSWKVQAVVRDPGAVELRRDEETRRGVGIIALSVTMIALGAGLSFRLVQRELDAARTKSEFAANLSHELRSPLTQIRLKGEALQLGLPADDEARMHHYDAIVRESERLSRMMDNMLDFGAIERGQKRYTLRPGDLGATVRHAVEGQQVAMELRGLQVILEHPEDLPVCHHDPDAVGQVLANLLSNAAKYGGDGGRIDVRVECDEREIRVVVADRGIGIAEEEQRRIFDQYYRSRDPRARRKKGTGIGLTVVKYIMDAHRGRVSVQSVLGRGTSFTLHFPIDPPAATSPRA